MSFVLILFFVGGFIHGALFAKIVAENSHIARKSIYIYFIALSVLVCHGLILSIIYEYLNKNNLKINGLKYAMSFGLATSFINIINQLCWFDVTPGHALISYSLLSYILLYLGYYFG